MIIYSTPVVSGCWIDPGGEERDRTCALLETDLLCVFPSFPFLPVVEVTEVLDAIAVVLPNCWTVTGVPVVFMIRFEFVIPCEGASELGRWWMVELGDAENMLSREHFYFKLRNSWSVN